MPAMTSRQRLTVRPVVVDRSIQDTLQAAAQRGDAPWFERFLALGFSPLLTVAVDDTQASGPYAKPLDMPLLNAAVRWDPSGQVPLALLESFWTHPRVRGEGLLVKHLQDAWGIAQREGRPTFLRGVAARLAVAPEAVQAAFLKNDRTRPSARSFTEKFWADHLHDSKAMNGFVSLPFFGPWIDDLRDWIVPNEWRAPDSTSPSGAFALYHTVRQQVRDAHGAPLTRLWSLLPLDAALLLAPLEAYERYTDDRSMQDALNTAADLFSELARRGVDCSRWTLGEAGRRLPGSLTDLSPDTDLVPLIQDRMSEMGWGGAAVTMNHPGAQAALHRLREAMGQWERSLLLGVAGDALPAPARVRL